MATATVYTIDNENLIVDQFDCEYELALKTYWSKPNSKGRYYVAKKGIKIPYEHKKKSLKKLPSNNV